MWFVAVLMFVMLIFMVHIVCEHFEMDESGWIRISMIIVTVDALLFVNYFQYSSDICKATQTSSVTPHKIIRDSSNNYYVINDKLDKEYIANVKLIEEGVSVV